MIITLGGAPGSGKSTVANALADKLGFTHIYAGKLFREKAQEQGLSILTYLQSLESQPDTEKALDKEILEAALKEKDVIVESRVAHRFLSAFKVFLDVDINESAHRIYEDKHRNETKHKSFDDALEFTKARIRTDTQRYKDLYGIDIYDKSSYDLIIDTTDMSVVDIVNTIIEALP